MPSVPPPSLPSTPSTTTRASADVGAVRTRNPPPSAPSGTPSLAPATLPTFSLARPSCVHRRTPHPPPLRPDRHAPARCACHPRKASTPSPSPSSAPSSARTPPSPRLDRHARARRLRLRRASPASCHLQGSTWGCCRLWIVCICRAPWRGGRSD
ncbi:hypothetical protein B0H14DRAFT_2725129 [Mycena olivaceomarginata]|nr:hypothetical protein B0H14DRAFT_2725129 [Mycena olivaceomarginata]